MDKETRNAIERATQKARRLLEEDFAEQLDGVFDVRADGRIASKGGAHLTGRQHLLRDKIVAAIEHKRSAGMRPEEAVADYVRDAAFTALNRFAALKMLEARELVKECVSRGDASSGFAEFCGLAPALKTADGAGYRLYIESIFDELSTEVKVLFDRRDPASVLWPTKLAFDDLLSILNDADLAGIWSEDETIGWVYQFFNSGEERRLMREVSQTPRNGRELAIRNQFFTPHYVVRFLSENTLARIWWEMRRGDTEILSKCEYMVRQPNESFSDREESKASLHTVSTVADVWRTACKTPLREKKDPRAIGAIDPACGSGHFLLYLFALFLMIYEEAWNDERSPEFEGTGRTLRDDYPDIESLRRAVPGLILRYNLFGIDIDPRCAQIAQLALWMRAQRAFKDVNIPRASRPTIRRANIVIAEPIPGDLVMVDQFAATLRPSALGKLFREIVSEMAQSSEMGAILPVDRRLSTLIEEANASITALEKSTRQGFLPGLTETSEDTAHHTSDALTGFASFEEAEGLLLTSLKRFVGSAVNGVGLRRRLFAEDAEQGIAFVELMSRRYDVVLMNPPFGSPSDGAKERIAQEYPQTKYDLGAAFVEEWRNRLNPSGRLGVIFNRTNWFLSRLQHFRSRLLDNSWLACNADLGLGVLDAFVETAMTVLESRKDRDVSIWFRLTDGVEREAHLKRLVVAAKTNAATPNTFVHRQASFGNIAGTAFSYWLSDALLRIKESAPLTNLGVEAKQGLATKDNFRFLRLHWELNFDDERWKLYSKGGAYAPLVGLYHLVIDWGDAAAAAYANRDGQFCCLLTGQSYRYAFRPCITYSQRTSRFSARVFPAGGLFDTKGSAVFSPLVKTDQDDPDQLLALCLLLNTPLAQFLFDSAGGASDEGKARDYSQGMVGALPCLPNVGEAMAPVLPLAREVIAEIISVQHHDPTSIYYVGLPKSEWMRGNAPADVVIRAKAAQNKLQGALQQAGSIYARALGMDSATQAYVDETVREMHREASHEALGVTEDKLLLHMRQSLLLSAFSNGPTIDNVAAIEGIAENPLRPMAWSPHSRAKNAMDILVSDPGHDRDLAGRMLQKCIEMGVDDDSIIKWFGADDLASWTRLQAFIEHVTLFSKSQRTAPVVWQLSTSSGSYSVWLFSYSLSRNTLLQVENDFIAPKLADVRHELELMRSEVGAAPSASQRKEIEELEAKAEELRVLREEVARVALIFDPYVEDGITICAAPLWRLFPQHNAWQSELRETWKALCKGEYDWARVAMTLWPERVVPRCATDRSVASAHGLEDVFWCRAEDGKWKVREKPKKAVDALVRERTIPSVKAALKSLLEAADAVAGPRRSRKTKAA